MAMTDMKTPDAIRAWASDWSNTFDQDWDSEKLRSYIGKTIKLESPPPDEESGPRQATVYVIGYSIDTLVIPVDPEDEEAVELPDVHRFSFLTSEGHQIALLAETTMIEIEQE